MTLRRRQQLVEIARQYDALVITDDVYDQLQWLANPSISDDSTPGLRRALLPRLVDIDRWFQGGAKRHGADGFGNVVSNGSFSKIAAPGVRCGWAEGSESFTWGLSQWYFHPVHSIADPSFASEARQSISQSPCNRLAQPRQQVIIVADQKCYIAAHQLQAVPLRK